MPRHTLPKHLGKCRVQTARAGNFIVVNNKTGKSQVIIPCRTRAQSDELCERLNRGEHNGEVWV